ALTSPAARMAQDYTLLAPWLSLACCGRCDALDRYRGVPLTVALLLELEHLAIELVRERVDRCVHVRLDAFGVDVLAAHVQIGRYLLPELVDGEHDIDVDDVVEVTRQPLQLGRHVGADRRRDVEMMAAQVRIHPGLLCVARSAAH